MKTKILFFMAAVLFTFWACDSDDETVEVKDNSHFVLHNFNYTGCKTISQAPMMIKEANGNPFAEEMIEFEGREGGFITLKHVNSIFNCASETIESTISVNDSIILIEENETGEILANCICPYDLIFDAGPLKSDTYTIIVKKGGLEYGKAQITFTPTAKGSVKLEVNP